MLQRITAWRLLPRDSGLGHYHTPTLMLLITHSQSHTPHELRHARSRHVYACTRPMQASAGPILNPVSHRNLHARISTNKNKSKKELIMVTADEGMESTIPTLVTVWCGQSPIIFANQVTD